MLKITCTATVAVLALGSLITGGGSAVANVRTTVSSSVSTSNEAPEQRDIRVRKEFGLDATGGHVDSLIKAANESATDTSFLGIPLTQAEVATLKSRFSLEDKVTKLQPVLNSLPGYGGMWIDQEHGGQVHVQVVQGAPVADKAAVSETIASAALTTTDAVLYAKSDLDDLVAKIAALDQAEPLKSAFSSVSVDVPHNAVSLVLKTTTGVGDLLPASLADRPELQVTASAGTWSAQSGRDIHSGHYYAGEYTSGAFGNCTIGFGNVISSYGNNYIATAGHCDHGDNGYTRYRGSGTTGGNLGTVHNSKYSDGGKSECDCEVVGPIDDGSLATPIVLDDGNSHVSLTRTATSASDFAVGEPVCLSGAQYGNQVASSELVNCGYITASSIEETYTRNDTSAPFTLAGGVTTNISGSMAGDSGGTCYNPNSHIFYGIHAAAEQNRETKATFATVFSKADHLDDLGVYLEY